ncbi:AAA family ATPase [Rhizobium sp. LEGMi198b]
MGLQEKSKGHLGDMQKAMFASFDEAKKKAPAILFIDEVDSFTDRDREQSHNASYVRLIGAGHLTGKQIVDGLKPDDTTDRPTPKMRRKIRQRLHG